MIIFETFKFFKVKIDMRNVGIRYVVLNIRIECFQKFGLAATANASNYFYIGSTDNLFKFSR